MITLAIDPGAKGGYAARVGDETITGSMPDTEGGILELLRKFSTGGHVCFLEDLVKFTGTPMPSSSMAVYAGNWGFLKGALMALGYRVHLVKPQAWQKTLNLGTSKGLQKREWKAKLRGEAERLFPGSKVTLSNADALLILRFSELAYQPRTHDSNNEPIPF